MANIIGYKEWLAATNGGPLSTRSRELKALDKTIENCARAGTQVNEDAVRKALINWIGSKRGNWQHSIRNKRGAIKNLLEQLGLADISAAESALRQAPQESLRALFAGRKLEWKPGVRNKMGNNKVGISINGAGLPFNALLIAHYDNDRFLDNLIGLPVGDIDAGGMRLIAAVRLMTKVFKAVVPADIRFRVAGAISIHMPWLMGDLLASMTPFMSEINTGLTAAWNLRGASLKQKDLVQLSYHKSRSFNEGEPLKAIEAMSQVLRRERNADLTSGAISSAALAAQLACLFADAGVASRPIIGCSSNLAKLANILRLIVRDIREKDAANRLLQQGVDISVFETSPITGAYYVCCASSSDLINIIYTQIGNRGWQNTAEDVLAKHIRPLQQQARELIGMHRFHIPGLEKYPGMIDRENSGELARMANNIGKTDMPGFGSDSLPAEAV